VGVLGRRLNRRCFGRVFQELKIAQRSDRSAFLALLHDEFSGRFAIDESSQAKDVHRISAYCITRESTREAMQKTFRFLPRDARDHPRDLVPAGRGIEDEIREWQVERAITSGRMLAGIPLQIASTDTPC
jgi:hypothetical protein